MFQWQTKKRRPTKKKVCMTLGHYKSEVTDFWWKMSVQTGADSVPCKLISNLLPNSHYILCLTAFYQIGSILQNTILLNKRRMNVMHAIIIPRVGIPHFIDQSNIACVQWGLHGLFDFQFTRMRVCHCSNYCLQLCSTAYGTLQRLLLIW